MYKRILLVILLIIIFILCNLKQKEEFILQKLKNRETFLSQVERRSSQPGASSVYNRSERM